MTEVKFGEDEGANSPGYVAVRVCGRLRCALLLPVDLLVGS